jgi:hypothetical protein
MMTQAEDDDGHRLRVTGDEVSGIGDACVVRSSELIVTASMTHLSLHMARVTFHG